MHLQGSPARPGPRKLFSVPQFHHILTSGWSTSFSTEASVLWAASSQQRTAHHAVTHKFQPSQPYFARISPMRERDIDSARKPFDSFRFSRGYKLSTIISRPCPQYCAACEPYALYLAHALSTFGTSYTEEIGPRSNRQLLRLHSTCGVDTLRGYDRRYRGERKGGTCKQASKEALVTSSLHNSKHSFLIAGRYKHTVECGPSYVFQLVVDPRVARVSIKVLRVSRSSSVSASRYRLLALVYLRVDSSLRVQR